MWMFKETCFEFTSEEREDTHLVCPTYLTCCSSVCSFMMQQTQIVFPLT